MIPRTDRLSFPLVHPETARRCDHAGLTVVDEAAARYAARCPDCGATGPVRPTPDAARKALLVLGARNSG